MEEKRYCRASRTTLADRTAFHGFEKDMRSGERKMGGRERYRKAAEDAMSCTWEVFCFPIIEGRGGGGWIKVKRRRKRRMRMMRELMLEAGSGWRRFCCSVVP